MNVSWLLIYRNFQSLKDRTVKSWVRLLQPLSMNCVPFLPGPCKVWSNESVQRAVAAVEKMVRLLHTLKCVVYRALSAWPHLWGGRAWIKTRSWSLLVTRGGKGDSLTNYFFVGSKGQWNCRQCFLHIYYVRSDRYPPWSISLKVVDNVTAKIPLTLLAVPNHGLQY